MTLVSSVHGSTSPTLWLAYDSTREARTLAHDAADGTVIVVHRTPAARRLDLALLYPDETAAAACETLHVAGGVLTITETGRPTVGMSYVVTGRIRRTFDPEHEYWTVEVEATEVPA